MQDGRWHIYFGFAVFCMISGQFFFELFSRAYGMDIQPDHSLAIFGYSELTGTFPLTHQ